MRSTPLVFSLLAAITASAPENSTPQDLQPRQISGDADQSGDCSGYALNRGTWAELGIDNYLLHYPGGQNLTLFDYTRSLNVLNFDCGIGRMCLAGQLCHPVHGRDWVVLSAVQEWNFYMNSVYEAVATAMGMVQGTSASMVADFLPEGDDKKNLINLTVGLVALSGIVLLGFTAALIVPILWRLLCATWSALAYTTSAVGSGIASAWAFLTTSGANVAVAGAVEGTEVAATTATSLAAREAAEGATAAALKEENSALVGGTAAKGLQKRSPKHHHETISHDKFQMWSALNANLEQFENRLQSIIAVTAKLTLYSPISSKDGLYGSLQNGTFLSDHPPKATLVDNARDTVQLGVLAQLFRVMNVIFVIDTNPCKQEGPTTPVKNPGAVHFCSSAGVKTSLAMVTPKKIDYEIRNGRLLFSKYSYSTEFLYQLATDCQTQRDNLGLPATNGTMTMANHGSGFLQNQALNPMNVTSTDIPNYQNNLTQSSAPINPNSNSSTILLPDGSSICSFPIPICDLRSPDIKSRISAGASPAKACKDFLKLPDVFF
ncbi:hypothetical protein PTTG_12546 [Puccinia triticina 1-1 BBBD Race 1]|uniref:DUF7872 domain-containing protein n=2 Tax=Puccinia triticina TaxID=208348 RepID=A0A180GGG5_PUCT1|nr:uncharacterized protein PtA15_7A799 [Puccinia triticina]OAV91836.1 hypothetical protein PTTG_12546 [Puccinia triticina 1-1 BBBD Race 1]WAQ87069.1 hypothetical protein PtA15_7A799 [Puccinia triticina]WAR56923.1 hypothetical protein PtB15_7B776 [Puccinia triticina]